MAGDDSAGYSLRAGIPWPTVHTHGSSAKQVALCYREPGEKDDSCRE